MNAPQPSPRRLHGCLIAALAYLATTALCLWLLRQPLAEAPTLLRAGVSLLPVIAIGFSIREVLRLVRASDELQRRIDLEALAVAAITVGLGCLSLSLLVGANVLAIEGKTVLTWILPALSVTYLIARFFAQARYR
ncbi:hypothetical protein [Dokdonella sp.]|uniref:hypothetical protein n=1 Tax=Dokdonella sp. TaxID=2291710 RepID=UPI003528FA1C